MIIKDMNLTLYKINNETILAVTFYGQNRNNAVLEAQKQVFKHFKFPINYIEWPFHLAGHGDAIQHLINQTLNLAIDYYLFIDMDAIALRADFIDDIYNKICDHKTVYGPAWTSNHKSPNHIHAASCFIAFSKKLYLELGCPEMRDIIPRSDTGEELSYFISEKGYNLCLVYPQSFSELTEEEMKETGNPKCWNLGGRLRYGLMTQYSNIFIHCGMQNIKRGNELFIQKSNEILNPKIEAVVVCKNYGDYLELTLVENHKYFDNIIVITDSEDAKTQEVCKKYPNVNCWYFTGWNKNNSAFNKGGALNFGLSKLKYNNWVCIMDSDTVIKENFKDKLTDINKFYGSYRRFIPKLENYKRLNSINSNTWDREKDNYEKIPGHGCGYWQVFNFNHPTIKKYGLTNLIGDSYSADQIDIDFLRCFCEFNPTTNQYSNLVDLKIELWHLGPHGVNHDGRSEKDRFFNIC